MDAEGSGRGAALRLAGTGRIGSEVRLIGADPGGSAPQWCRDGTAIPGATGAAYVPGPEDDGSALTCRVALPGGGEAVTAPLAVSYPPPALVAEPCEEIFDQGSGPQAIAAAPWFSGEALRFAAAGAGADIDPATGVLSIPTEAALADRVTVTARNSGGSAAGAFMVTVEGERFELPAVAAAEWEVAAGYDPERPGRPLVEIVRVLAGPALAATRLQLSAAAGADAGPDGFVACAKHRAFDDPESPFHRCWLGRADGGPARQALVPGTLRRTMLRYSLDDPATPLAEAVLSPNSDARLWLVEAPAQPAAAAPGWSVLPVLTKANYEAFVNRGVLSGDAGQYMLGAGQSEADPDRIYTCQDTGGVWVSLDHGNSWNNLMNRGLYTRTTTGIAVDPLDSRRVFLLTWAGVGTAGLDHIGLQRSLDGGLTWERVIPNDESPGRVIQGPVNFAPTSKDPKLGYATRWYCIVQRYSSQNPGGRPHRFYRSDDGGATWRLVRELAPRTYGSIYHLVVSPADPETVYVNSDAGLWRFEAAGDPAGRVTPMSGANGLPEGGIRDRIHLGADDRTLIVGVTGQGVYRSLDAGGSWTLVHADPDLLKLHVNPWDPRRMIVSYPRRGRQLQVSTDGGASFAEPESVSPGPIGPRSVIGETSCLVVWHPGNPDRIWAHGGPQHWQSDDGGRNWRPANGYFNGKQHQNWFADQMFDPVDPDRFAYFMTDFGVAVTHNRGLWFDLGRMVTRALDVKHSSVNGGAIHPDPARGIILASVGRMNSGKLVISRDDGATWAVASDGDRRRQYVGFDLDDPSYVFQWRERSTDHGVTWSEMAALPPDFAVSGMTLTAPGMRQGQAIFAIDRDSGSADQDEEEEDGFDEEDAAPAPKPGRSGGRNPGGRIGNRGREGGRNQGRNAGGGGRGDNSRILRSLDRGESWQPFAASPYDFGLPGMFGGGPCRAHPSDPDVFFTKGPNDWTIRKWVFGGKPVDLNVMGGFPGGRPPDGMFTAMSLAIDRRHPDVMYVMNTWDGVPNKFFRTVDGGRSWENISEGFPGTFVRGLEVSPTTGDVFIGSANGSRVLPPPYRETSAARSTAPSVWGQRFLDRPY